MKSIHARVSVAFVILSFTVGCGIESSLVGGRCKDGTTLSGDTCVAPQPGVTLITPTDPPATSATGTATGSKLAAPSSKPEPAVDPTEPTDPTHSDPTDPITDIPEIIVPEPVPTPLVCAAPLVACHGKCISVTSDPANCGACGKICPSNICIDGECQGAMPGDVVLIGHDFTNANAGSAQAKVLVNALSIPTTDPIRVLSYEDGASEDAVVRAKLVATAGIRGREVSFERADSAGSLTSMALSRAYDVVLIHDASAGDALETGASWSASLGEFTMKGGVVVALDNGSSPMPELLTSSGLLAVASHTLLPAATHLVVTAAGDVVGAQVLSPYAAFGAPVSFQGLAPQSADLAWVVRTKTDAGPADPIVVHRIVR